MTDPTTRAHIQQAAQALRDADAILVAAGAGMGVDSGLPDFRGAQGFWKAYPAYKHLNLGFSNLANPRWFRDDPGLAWGFYGHRMHLYRDTSPHEGFAILRRVAAGRPVAVFTSNVDGQFQRAGFDPQHVFEVHGSIHHLQCSRPCRDQVWAARDTHVDVDPETFRASDPFPRCPACDAVARPNILMFGDGAFLGTRADDQHARYQNWRRAQAGKKLAVVEMGAGSAVPTVRMECDATASHGQHTLIRINPREPHGPAGTLGLPMGALEALRLLEAEASP